ncbi:MAG: GH32 C-terminal domain-containing protein [Firmicutes bacterium]|nr:GH32 C-terminal domain-containing protein [Bacillota bacterium]
MHAKHASQVIRKTRRAYPGHVNLRVVLDSCSIELFINLGEEAITSLIFIDNEFYRMSLHGKMDTLLHSSGFYRGKIPEAAR